MNLFVPFRRISQFAGQDWAVLSRRHESEKRCGVDPKIMSGTRVPARTLIDYIEGSDSLDDFLEDFPTVTRKQAIAFLEEASERVLVAS